MDSYNHNGISEITTNSDKSLVSLIGMPDSNSGAGGQLKDFCWIGGDTTALFSLSYGGDVTHTNYAGIFACYAYNRIDNTCSLRSLLIT